MADLLGILSFKSIMTALRLGVFEAIGHGSKSLDELTLATGSDRIGLSFLVSALDSLGYVRLRRGRIRNTGMTQKWLLQDSRCDISPLFNHFNDMATRWDYLDQSIRHGRPPLLGWEWLDRDQKHWDAYHAGLKSTAVLISPDIIRKITIPRTAEQLLDLGGSHGQYAVEFCRHYPRLSAVVYDWTAASRMAMENILSSGLSSRIAFHAGDFLKDEIPAGQDVILMFNIIRIFDPAVLKTVLIKVHDALKRGGMVIIMDHIGKPSSSRFMRANAFLVLLEIFNSTEGRIYSSSELSGLLGETGFDRVRGYNLKHSPGLGLITATRP